MGVLIKINVDWFFDRGGQFFLQSIYEVRHPSTAVIVVAVGDEDVVFETWDDGRHVSNIGVG